MRHFLDFEKPIAALEGKVEELRHMSSDGSINIADEIGKLQSRIERELKQTYEKLGPWEKVQVARHPDRPRVSSIINQLFDDFTPLAGDRNYAEDYAVIGGMARFRGQGVMVMGTEKGSSTEEGPRGAAAGTDRIANVFSVFGSAERELCSNGPAGGARKSTTRVNASHLYYGAVSATG